MVARHLRRRPKIGPTSDNYCAKHTNASAIRHATRDDGRDNRVTVHTLTRRPTRRPSQHKHVSSHVRRDDRRDGNVTVLKKIALPITHVVALVCCANDEIVCLKNRRDVPRDVARDVARAIALLCFTLLLQHFLYITAIFPLNQY